MSHVLGYRLKVKVIYLTRLRCSATINQGGLMNACLFVSTTPPAHTNNRNAPIS